MYRPIPSRPLAAAALTLGGTVSLAWGVTMMSPDTAGSLGFSPAQIVPLAEQRPARLAVDAPLPEPLARGLVVVRYRAENLRIVPVYGAHAKAVSPRLGHLHVTLDDAPWHWVDASGEPLILQGLPPGPHTLRIDLADPTHQVIDSTTLTLEVPRRPGHP